MSRRAIMNILHGAARCYKENAKDYGNNFLWLGDIQEQATEALYVDEVHYTNRFSKEIAMHIGRFLLERKLCAGEQSGEGVK